MQQLILLALRALGLGVAGGAGFELARSQVGGAPAIAGGTGGSGGSGGLFDFLSAGQNGGKRRARRRKALTNDDMRLALTIASSISKKAAETFINQRVRTG